MKKTVLIAAHLAGALALGIAIGDVGGADWWSHRGHGHDVDQLEVYLAEADPAFLSIKYDDEASAMDLFDQANNRGEVVCLTELRDEPDGVVRHWVHSCG